MPTQAAPGRTRLGLFGRVYLGLCLTGLMLALLVGGTVYLAANSYGQAWVDESMSIVEGHREDFIAAKERRLDPEELKAQLELELDAHVKVLHRPFGRRGGHPPLAKPDKKRLRRGLPVVHKRGPFAPPVLFLGLPNEDESRVMAVLEIRPRARPQRLFGVMLLAALGLFGASAWLLTRNPTRRLNALRGATIRVADGELDHRVPRSDTDTGDEIDELAGSFNVMAERLEGLVAGQKTLLANVSHELRTPIARMRVLNEILADRLDVASTLEPDPDLEPHLARLTKGLHEMEEDLGEMETLVADLLTSGRLELGGNTVLRLAPTPVAALCERVGRRFDAKLVVPPISVDADEVLLERVLSNLLANARRACPDGEVRVIGHDEGDRVLIAVEDEGRGIPEAAREKVFEPFARLDQARDRDRGGVGLGLFLCRQIARAHRGDIWAEDRPDGKAGARLVLAVPRQPASQG